MDGGNDDMNANQLVNDALLAGAMLATDGKQIIVKAKSQPPANIVQGMRQQKSAVIAELHHRQTLWVQSIALALEVEPRRLFESGAITHGDMLEHWHTDPLEVAKAIRLPPEPPPAPRPSRCADCVHFQRTRHPNLGHCAKGQPEAAGGLWDTDPRYCEVASFE